MSRPEIEELLTAAWPKKKWIVERGDKGWAVTCYPGDGRSHWLPPNACLEAILHSASRAADTPLHKVPFLEHLVSKELPLSERVVGV